MNRRMVIVSNDHGLIVAKVWRHRGSEGHPTDYYRSTSGLYITRRNAVTGLEIPDNGECAGDAGRLPSLPGYCTGGGGGGRDGVLDADVRRCRTSAT